LQASDASRAVRDASETLIAAAQEELVQACAAVNDALRHTSLESSRHEVILDTAHQLEAAAVSPAVFTEVL
jgi:hypothetical protein